MTIPYSQGYINDIVERGEKILGLLSYYYGHAKSLGNCGDKYANDYDELEIYVDALCHYDVDAESNNLTSDQKDSIIEKVIFYENRYGCNSSDLYPVCTSDCDVFTILNDNGFVLLTI